MYNPHNWRLQHPQADGALPPDTEDKKETAPGADGTVDDSPADSATASEPPKDTISMSKADYDAELKKAELRGQRRSRRKATTPAASADGDEDAAGAAEAKLQKANERMLAATVKTVGADLAISANGMKAAARLIDTGECFDEAGEVDEDAVKDALETFLKDYPEFQRAAEKRPAFQAQGNPKNAKPSTEQAKKDALGVK